MLYTIALDGVPIGEAELEFSELPASVRQIMAAIGNGFFFPNEQYDATLTWECARSERLQLLDPANVPLATMRILIDTRPSREEGGAKKIVVELQAVESNISAILAPSGRMIGENSVEKE